MKFALSLYDDLYLVDVNDNKHKVLLSINKNDSSFNNYEYICSVNFDRSGEAIALGTSNKLVQIYDVQRG